jgi:hypothetical protein
MFCEIRSYIIAQLTFSPLFGAVFEKWNAHLGGHAIFQNALHFFSLYSWAEKRKEIETRLYV